MIGCSHSEGLTDFYWSHDGYWFCEYINIGFTSTARVCAKACYTDPTCVAINYYHAYRTCYHYHDSNCLAVDKQMANSNSQAYIKCTGNIVILPIECILI